MSEGVLGIIVGIIVGAILVVGLTFAFPEYTKIYKQAQIDAINGKILFELKKQEDGSVVWERK